MPIVRDFKHDKLMEWIDYKLDNLARQIHGLELNTFPLNYTFLSQRQLRVLSYGEGENKLISIYGIHGDEKSPIQAFIEFPEHLPSLEVDYSDVSYIGILANPNAVWQGVRKNHSIEFESDFNRGWTDPLLQEHEDLVCLIERESLDCQVIALDHHSDKRGSNPYFVLPKRAVEYIDFRKKQINEEYTDIVNSIGDELIRHGFDIPHNHTQNVIYPFSVTDKHTLHNYLAEKGITSLVLEDPNKRFESMVDMHIEADIAALKYLSRH